ncbi:MAG TPA: hydroxysqualene dehydroxylase HpnE [Variovorax sp.]
MSSASHRVAIIGGGWAGLACAVEATRAGHAVSVFEAARRWGGRARTLPVTLPGGAAAVLDNGQHILIGAYTETLALMSRVGIDVDAVLERLPLSLRFPDGSGFSLPSLPSWLDRATRHVAPLDVVAGVLRARGWSWSDKRSLLATSTRWQDQRFRCGDGDTVDMLCRSLTPRVRAELTEPLCLSALNTVPAQASGKVFLRVLEDALFKTPGGSQLLLPRVDLGALFPEAAADWLRRQGAQADAGRRVQGIAPDGAGWRVDDASFDRVVLACAPWDAARLMAELDPAWSASADALRHEAIATIYLQGGISLPAPMLALRFGPRAPAQFVLDRGRLGGAHGLLAFVISASQGEREALQEQVLEQARVQLGMRNPQPVATVVERRATFACTPGLVRPPMRLAHGLLACGDYVEGPYPSTLEGAVRSALAAAAAL